VLAHVTELDVHRHEQPVLAHVGLIVERDRLDAVADHLAVEDRVGLLGLDYAEATVRSVRLDDRAGQEALDGGLAGLVREHRHRPGLDVIGKIAAERIAAACEAEGVERQAERRRAAGPRYARVTNLTGRLGTTTNISTRRGSP